jgi:aminoglycoside 3-N-acetyltransferase
MLQQILNRIPSAQKSKLRGWYNKTRVAFVRRFRSYDAAALKECLRDELGIRSGHTLLVHSAFGPLLGFHGSPTNLLNVFLEIVGPTGNLVMVSNAFFSSASEYLRKGDTFDVRKTPSKMGLVSETFRRQPGVLRSLHPTHPVLAFGPRAQWIVAGHETCLYPCGPGSPFEKLVELRAKILFYGVSEFHFTLHHYLEHLVKDELPFALYEAEPYVVNVIDAAGHPGTVRTYAFTSEAISRRRVGILFAALAEQKKLPRARIGNTPMVLLDARETVECTKDLASGGVYFYDFTGTERTPSEAVHVARKEAVD